MDDSKILQINKSANLKYGSVLTLTELNDLYPIFKKQAINSLDDSISNIDKLIQQKLKTYIDIRTNS